MRVLVLAVGSVKGPLAAATAEYERRAGRYWKLQVAEVPGGVRGSRTASPEAVREAEADRLLLALPSALEVVALTRLGKAKSSRELAGYMEGLGTRAAPGVAFVIGGAFGLGDGVLKRAHKLLALSDLTLPHEMARTVLAEQLYRAGTIVRGEPYHKG